MLTVSKPAAPEEPPPMLTQGDDVEVHALAGRGWSISAIARHLERDRKTVRAYVRGERTAGVRRSAVPDPLEPFAPYLAARFADDPHLWLTALFDEVGQLGYPRSYPSFVRAVRAAGLRPHCEPCRGVSGRATIEIEHPPGAEIQWDPAVERRWVTDDPRAATPAPTSLDAALAELPGANLAIISTPGPYATAEALRALKSGLDIFLFSDNVSVADEVELKRMARSRGRLLMGPDCGTAILDGIPLGFANAVRRGPVGIVAASGTGSQQVACLVDRLGSGISQAIGAGGRDLHDEVGGLMMSAALERLATDPGTGVVVIAQSECHELTRSHAGLPPNSPGRARRNLAALSSRSQAAVGLPPRQYPACSIAAFTNASTFSGGVPYSRKSAFCRMK
jgi:hypothetical protein